MNLTTRNRYHTQIIWCVSNKKESLLQKEFLSSIPASTKSTWRNTPQQFVGATFIPHFQESLDFFELTIEHQRLKKILFTICRTWINVYNFIQSARYREKAFKSTIIDSVQSLSKVLPLKRSCKLFRISVQSYYYHIRQSVCELSPINLCFKRHNNQLSLSEVNTIKIACNDGAFASWPLISVYYHLLREKKLNIGLSTFYKYARQLDLKRKFGIEMIHKKGIQTQAPNQFFHVDTTYKKISDGSKGAVVFVSDNYSKAILGWHLTTENNSCSVLSALKMTIGTLAEFHPDQLLPVMLVADGGKENHALTISELLEKQTHPPISKVIARKDIRFSNSPAEAVNKIFKRFLRKHPPRDFEHLEQLLEQFIRDYNHRRPHASLKGFTPMEAYAQKLPPFQFSDQISAQRAIRKEQNIRNRCIPCM